MLCFVKIFSCIPRKKSYFQITVNPEEVVKAEQRILGILYPASPVIKLSLTTVLCEDQKIYMSVNTKTSPTLPAHTCVCAVCLYNFITRRFVELNKMQKISLGVPVDTFSLFLTPWKAVSMEYTWSIAECSS